MMHMGDIMSTVGDTILCNLSTVGDIMHTMEGVQYREGTQIIKDFPTVLNTPTVLKISPTVLNILHSIQDIPHMHYDIPPRY